MYKIRRNHLNLELSLINIPTVMKSKKLFTEEQGLAPKKKSNQNDHSHDNDAELETNLT